jgi:hypothetical protein
LSHLFQTCLLIVFRSFLFSDVVCDCLPFVFHALFLASLGHREPILAILGTLSAILGPSWEILGYRGAILGHLWASLGSPWTISGPTSAILGPAWGHLGASLGPSWAHVGLLGAMLIRRCRRRESNIKLGGSQIVFWTSYHKALWGENRGVRGWTRERK